MKIPIPASKGIEKKERGWLKYAYKETNKIFVAKWKDNSIFTLRTNYDTMDQLHSVKRWSKDMKKNVDTQRPYLCAAYVQEMGGVDSLDQAINVYRIGIRRKKWWWVLFTHMLNTCMVNAWRLYLLANEEDPMDLLNFMRHVTRHYMRLQQCDAQRAATFRSKASGRNHGDIFHKNFPTSFDAVIATNRRVGVVRSAK